MRANCVICSDFFDEINPISAATCGHVYHSSCLSLWIAQSKTCPQCRIRVISKDIKKLYFNFPPSSVTNCSELENEVLNLKAQLSAKNIELQTCKKEKEDTVAFVRDAEKKASALQQAAYKNESEIAELRLRVKHYSKLEAKILKLEQMNEALTNHLQHLNNVQTIVNGTQKDAENILQEYSNKSKAMEELATHCTCLKRELQKVIESRTELCELNSKLKRDNGILTAKVKSYEDARTSTESAGKSQTKRNNFSSEKKWSLLNVNPTNTSVLSTPSSSMHKRLHEHMSMDISPLIIPFNKSKFNMCIKTSSNVTYKTDSGSPNDVKAVNIPSLIKQNNDNSIIRTGYNGLGGHSNFINRTSQFKKIKNSKRKCII